MKIGTVGEERFVVSQQHVIDFAHDRMRRKASKTTSVGRLLSRTSINGTGLCTSKTRSRFERRA